MKRIILTILSICIIFPAGLGQVKENTATRILFHGLVMDASSFAPLPNSQIMINRSFSTVSSTDGTFAFYVYRNDTVVFMSLGYKPAILYVSDTLTAREFIAGIYMHSDTLSIGEVVILPRYTNLKSEILNSKSKAPSTMDNARYNVAVSAYQGRTTQGKLGDPATNYEHLRQQQKVNAYERGGIPSDKILGFNPLMVLTAAYMLLRGMPEKAAPLTPRLSGSDIDQIQKKYLETLKQRK